MKPSFTYQSKLARKIAYLAVLKTCIENFYCVSILNYNQLQSFIIVNTLSKDCTLMKDEIDLMQLLL